jgi:hypothetical protein
MRRTRLRQRGALPTSVMNQRECTEMHLRGVLVTRDDQAPRRPRTRENSSGAQRNQQAADRRALGAALERANRHDERDHPEEEAADGARKHADFRTMTRYPYLR